MDVAKRILDNQKKLQQDNAVTQRHDQSIKAISHSQEVMARSFANLIGFLDNKTTKTEVINQLRQIGTPDVKHVVGAVEELHKTLKTHENTDLSEVTKVLESLLTETKQIPKELPDAPEQKFIDYTKQYSKLESAIKAVEKTVKAQKLVAEAPIVKIPSPIVHVEKPDLSGIEDGIERVVKAYKMPDTVKTEQTNTLINEKFDEYKIIYDQFDEDEPTIESIKYYYKKRKVAQIDYKYDSDGNLLSGKKA